MGGKDVLGRKEQGVDYYRYYRSIIQGGERGKWAGEYARDSELLRSLGLETRGRTLLDISGEPGFYAVDARHDGVIDPVVTAFAGDVATTMREELSVRAFGYDFNSHDLPALVDRKFGWIAARWCIGFCENLPKFLAEAATISEPGAILFIQYPTPSQGLCYRWMFDDYTYLRLCSEEWVTAEALKAGFSIRARAEGASYHFMHDTSSVPRMIMAAYSRLLSRPTMRSRYHEYQHNLTLVFTLN